MSERFWNVLSLQGKRERIRDLRLYVASHDGKDGKLLIDFNVLEPVPSSLHIPFSPSTMLSYYAYKYVFKPKYVIPLESDAYWERYLYRLYLRNKERYAAFISDYGSFLRYCNMICKFGISFSRGQRFYENLRHYGYGTALEWIMHNWGIISNSYDSEVISFSKIAFAVNGGVPVVLYKKLSKLFPDVMMIVRYASAHPAKDCGFLQIKAGKILRYDVYEGTDTFTSTLEQQQADSILKQRDELWKAVNGCRGISYVQRKDDDGGTQKERQDDSFQSYEQSVSVS